jgi:hypothetical protein
MSAAVRARPSRGAYRYTTAVTTAISIATQARLCQRKMVLESGITPPATSAPPVTGSRPATMARVPSCIAPAVAIWSAADPESPCAHTLPRPRNALAATAR